MKTFGFFDGGCHLDKEISFAWKIYKNGDVFSNSEYFPATELIAAGLRATNHVAEYMGLFDALKWIEANARDDGRVHIYGDDLMILKQMTGSISFREFKPYVPVMKFCKTIKCRLPNVFFEFVPSDKNEAHELAEKALKNGKNINLFRDFKWDKAGQEISLKERLGRGTFTRSSELLSKREEPDHDPA